MNTRIKKLVLSSSLICIGLFSIYGQIGNVGIGTTTPDSSAILELESESQGLLIPRMTSIQIENIHNPADGLLVYDNTLHIFKYRKNSEWVDLADSTVHWVSNGNDIYNSNTGNVGVGTISPFSKLEIAKGPEVKFSLTRTNPLSLTGEGAQDPISSILFRSQNGGNYRNGAIIKARQEGNWIVGDTRSAGTALEFFTQSASFVNHLTSPRMTINSSGFIGIGKKPISIMDIRSNKPTLTLESSDEVGIPGASERISRLSFRGQRGSVYRDAAYIEAEQVGAWHVNDEKWAPTHLNFYTQSAGGTDLLTEPRMTISSSGHVGIGVTGSPQRRLHIARGSAGTFASSTNTTAVFESDNNNYISLLNPASFENGILFGNPQSPASGGIVYNSGTDANGLQFRTNGNQVKMVVKADGHVVIGNTTPAAGHLLSVDGKVECEELRVDLSEEWPDYVFMDGYKLPSLKDVKEYIDLKGHLPGIPSATAIENEGLEVGEMQRKMMEKIEELTLYIIQQNERIEALEGELKKRK